MSHLTAFYCTAQSPVPDQAGVGRPERRQGTANAASFDGVLTPQALAASTRT
jgi:hypothetical protein